jgi:hypothetical protein
MRKNINEIFHIEMDYKANTRFNLILPFLKTNSVLSGYFRSGEARAVSTEGTHSTAIGLCYSHTAQYVNVPGDSVHFVTFQSFRRRPSSLIPKYHNGICLR